jgi:hypothetical protein
MKFLASLFRGTKHLSAEEIMHDVLKIVVGKEVLVANTTLLQDLNFDSLRFLLLFIELDQHAYIDSTLLTLELQNRLLIRVDDIRILINACMTQDAKNG